MMNFGDYPNQTSTPSYNYYSNVRNNLGYTNDVAGSHQYWDHLVGYREEVGRYNMEAKQIFSKSPERFKHCTPSANNPICNFQNQNIPATMHSYQFQDRVRQNSTRNSIRHSERIYSGKYSEQSQNTCLRNTFNNYRSTFNNEFAKCNVLKNDYALPVRFDSQSSGNNDFNTAQRVGIHSCSYEEHLSNVNSLLYEHGKPYGMNSELEHDQSYNSNTFPPVYKNSTKKQHHITPTSISEKTIPLGVDNSCFDIYSPRPQRDKDGCENISSVHVDPHNHHWNVLGMGIMKMECWEVIVFRRNHSVYINTVLMAESISLATSLVKRLVGSKATERMTHLEVSILKYIKCSSATSHNTGLISLGYFLNKLYEKLNDKKPYNAQIKSRIKTFIDDLHSGFVPVISNIPHDLTSFFHFDPFGTTSIQDGSENPSRQFKVVSHLVLNNKSFSLIEYDGDFYMHLGEMVFNGLFPSINFARRKYRKMHIKTKWLDSLESKYLNLSQEQELIRFSDLRILCGLILYLHPSMQNDLLQMFSAMDLPDHISSHNNHLGAIKYTQNCLPIKNTARKELQYQTIRPHSLTPTADNQKHFMSTESLQTGPTGYAHTEVNSASWTKNLQPVDPGAQMEMPGQNFDNDIRNANHSTITGKNIPSIPKREISVLPEGRIVPPSDFLPEEPIQMDSVNSKTKMDILDVAFKEFWEGAVDICPSSQILHKPNKRYNCTTPETQQHSDPDVCDLNYKQEKGFNYYATSILENLQVQKGNDKLTYVNQNCNYIKQSLKSKSISQVPEDFHQRSTFNNSIFESQMEHSQWSDPTVSTMVTNVLPVSSNTFGSRCTANQPATETSDGSGTNASVVNGLNKNQTDLQKCYRFPNPSNFFDGSNINQYNAFESGQTDFDRNQSKQMLSNQSIALHSNIPTSPATTNARGSEISTSPFLSDTNQIYNGQIRFPFLNTVPFGGKDTLLYTLPQITLPTLSNDQNGEGSFEEPEKGTFSDPQQNFPLTIPSSKNPYFFPNISYSKISTAQDNTLQYEELLPPITHCEIDHMLYDTTKSSSLSLGDGQPPIDNTPGQSLQINDISSLPMIGSVEESRSSPYKTELQQFGNQSSRKATDSDCLSFQIQKSCPGNATISVPEITSKAMQVYPENIEEIFPVVKDVTSGKITSCSETPTTKNLEQFIKYEKLPESREVAFNSVASKTGIALQKSQIYDQEITCQLNLPCIASTVIQRSYKEQSLEEKLLDEKPGESDVQKEPRWGQVNSDTLEIASMAAIDTLVMETYRDTFCNSVSQNLKTRDNYSSTLHCSEKTDTHVAPSPILKTSDIFESEIKESKYAPNDEFVQFNSARKEAITELADLNEQNTPSLISHPAATKQHKVDSLFCTNSKCHKDISDIVSLDSQNYPYPVVDNKRTTIMEPDITNSHIKFVDEGQSITPNSTRVENEENCPFLFGYQPMKTNSMTPESECNMTSVVLNKHEKQLNYCSEITSNGMGSMKYACSSADTKAKNNLGVLFPRVNYQATNAKQISVLDLLNMNLYVTGNRLHLDVAITDQAKKVFEKENKDNPEQAEKICLQQLANDCCQFTKCWFAARNSQKNVSTNVETQSDVATRDRSIQLPSLLDPTIISCMCSKQLCDVSKIPENGTSKKHKTYSKEENFRTSDIFHNIIEELPCGTNQSNFVLFEKIKDHNNTYIDSSKFCEIGCVEQTPLERNQYCKSGFKSKSTKRKISCSENGLLKRTKYNKMEL